MTTLNSLVAYVKSAVFGTKAELYCVGAYRSGFVIGTIFYCRVGLNIYKVNLPFSIKKPNKR